MGKIRCISAASILHQLDYEGEIGRDCRDDADANISPANALGLRLPGYSIFNDATLRDYQFQDTTMDNG